MNTDDVVAVSDRSTDVSTPCSTPMRARPISSIGSGSNRRPSTCWCTWATRRSPTTRRHHDRQGSYSAVTMSSSPLHRRLGALRQRTRGDPAHHANGYDVPWPQRRTSLVNSKQATPSTSNSPNRSAAECSTSATSPGRAARRPEDFTARSEQFWTACATSLVNGTSRSVSSTPGRAPR